VVSLFTFPFCVAVLCHIQGLVNGQIVRAWAYLRDVLARLPNMTNRQIPEVTPEAWSTSRRTSQPQPAS